MDANSENVGRWWDCLLDKSVKVDGSTVAFDVDKAVYNEKTSEGQTLLRNVISLEKHRDF